MSNHNVDNSFTRIETASTPVKKFDTLAELISDFTFILRIEKNGRYILDELSEGFTTITGYPSKDLPDIQALIPPKKETFIKNVLENLKPGENSSLDFALQTKAEKNCWLHVWFHCQPAANDQPKRILGAAVDITEQKQSQQKREDLTHKLQMLNDIKQLLLTTKPLAETLESVLYLLKLLIPYTQGEVVEYDRLTEELHIIASTRAQYPTLVHENRLPLSFVDYPHDPPWHDIIFIPDLVKRATLSPFQRIQRTHGVRSLMVAPLYNHQDLFGYINIGSDEPNAYPPDQHTIFLDVAYFIALRMQRSYLKQQQTNHALQLEALVEQRTADLKKLIDQLEESNRMKDEFLAAMSHELRTPLHIILGKAEVLQDGIYGALNAKQLRAAVVIQEHGDRLLKLINNLLDVSLLDADQITISFSPIDIQSLCQQLTMAMYRTAQKKHIKIESDVPTQPIEIYTDESRLEQIVLILLDNAIKFTPEGGKVGLNVALDEAHTVINFEVWDLGIGIAPDMIDSIFMPFKQLDGRLSREYGGTGLGLPLAHRLTQLLDGTLSVSSEIGQGSRFTVSLPLKNVQASKDDEVSSEQIVN